MPDITRLPLRMDCVGVDYTHPVDRMPAGAFPYLSNIRVIEEGRLEGRPGYSTLLTLTDPPNSIRRLNDSTGLAPLGYAYVGGGGTKLYFGNETAYTPIDTGYSGDPLSLIPFRPDQSPQSWMYVYDKNKSSKIRPDGVLQAIGVAPPRRAPVVDLGVPANVTVTDGQSTTGWAASGISTTIGSADRTAGSAATIGNILYNTGNTGWCCINPSALSSTYWMGQRMGIILNAGHSNAETTIVREIHQQVASTTIQSILYDSGAAGYCSIALTTPPDGLARNSLLQLVLGSTPELVRVLEVVSSPDGTGYSIRCFTVLSHVAGEVVNGALSWYVYTTKTHAAAETMTSAYVTVDMPSSGVGAANLTANVNAEFASGRRIDPANDWMHISLYIQNIAEVTNIQVLLSLDPTPNFSFTNPGNSYIWTLTQEQLAEGGASDNSWTEILMPISSAVRSGVDLTRDLGNISGVAVQMTSAGTCPYGLDWMYLFGTYGPVIQPNAPTGYVFQSRNRNSQTGAYSVPGPQTRYQIFPLREAVTVTPLTSTQVGVDELDIYVQGGTIVSPTVATTLYAGSVMNNPASPNTFIDGLSDVFILEVAQPPDLTAFQPWPVLIPPVSGMVNVSGTTVQFVSGNQFLLNMLSNTTIFINGQAYLTYGQPVGYTILELTQDAGSLSNVPYSIPSPTLAAQPLPFVFGPLEGPFAPVVFALGDTNNEGLLYFSNFANADTASDQNTIEISTPSSGLVSGAVWNGLCFAGSRDIVYCIRYSYLTTIGASNSTTYQWYKVNTPSGMWSRWACCACPIGVAYLGRDGIYICTDTQGVNITDDRLYPLFPHDGQPATSIKFGNFVVYPVDMTQLTKLRLTYCDETLRFTYVDINGNYQTLVYGIYKKRWLPSTYANSISAFYLVEWSPDTTAGADEILALSVDTNSIVEIGGPTDNGAPIVSVIGLPSMDGGDERSQKLYVDTMVQADGVGSLLIQAGFNNYQTLAPPVTVTCNGTVQQFLDNIASLSNLALYRNVGAIMTWTGGIAGPRVYAWEMSGFLQPYLSTFFVTQYFALSFPGWKHLRRLFPALISNGPVLLTVNTQDGRSYGPYTIPSTGGQYRILPQMLAHGIKDLAFAFQLDGQGVPFAIFPNDFTCEVKEWIEETYIDLAVLKA